MAIEHVQPGEVVDLETFASAQTKKTAALVKTEHLEVIRMHVGAGGKVAEHRVDGPITVQCLQGRATFVVAGEPREMRAGSWLHLEGGADHAIEAAEDTVLLVTILFPS